MILLFQIAVVNSSVTTNHVKLNPTNKRTLYESDEKLPFIMVRKKRNISNFTDNPQQSNSANKTLTHKTGE